MEKSILITNQDTDLDECSMGIPWESTVAMHNMQFPKEVVNINGVQGWVDQLGDLQEITSIFIDCALKKEEYNFLNELTNIEQIYILNAPELDHIDFIKGKGRLSNLCILNSAISDLNPLVELMEYQSKLYEKGSLESLVYTMENVYINRAKIKDLSCFCGYKGRLSELNLRRNEIVDLTPLKDLHIYYANFSYNQIESAENFMTTHQETYLMNFRHNNIKSMEFVRNYDKNGLPARLFIGENLIDDYSMFDDCNFVRSDVLPLIQ